MDSLETKLEQLGLAQYAEALAENGFENWETVLDITEDDLDELGFKLGHRRVLQREIASHREPPASPGDRRTPNALQSGNENFSPSVLSEESSTTTGKRPKRRYRWHPRADPNAPKRPKTAYVNFADHLRTDAEVAGMTFVDIAREVGRQWQVMDADTKQEWENQAATVGSLSRLTELSLHLHGHASIRGPDGGLSQDQVSSRLSRLPPNFQEGSRKICTTKAQV